MFRNSIFLLAFALWSATSFAQSVPTPESAPDTLIVLQRGACEQRCSVYRVVIFSDGTVIYEGRYFVRQPGLIKSIISQDVLARLISDFDTGGFFQLEDNYGYGNKGHCETFQPGEPSAILTVSNRGRTKTILHSHGCAGDASKRLTELEDKVDKAVGAAKWIK
jgi:hypothetical protein